MGLTKISGGVIQSDNFSVGVITATSLQIGSATTIHTTGIDLGSGNITSHNINSTGIITATGVTVTGDLNVAGVLTYDDVTNIDSIGVVTARSGIHVTGGSVGIGTDNPTNMLDIAGSAPIIELNDTDTGVIHRVSGNSSVGQFYFDSDINNVSSDGSFVFRHGHLSGGGQVFSISSVGTLTLGPDSGKIRRSGDIDTYINFDGSNEIEFATANVERLRITSSGNVGIGTDNPQEKLHVLGTSDFVVDTDTSGLRFGSYGEYDIALVTGRNTSANSSRVYIENGDGEALRINSVGRVGINSSIPASLVDIRGESAESAVVNIRSYDKSSAIKLWPSNAHDVDRWRMAFWENDANTLGNDYPDWMVDGYGRQWMLHNLYIGRTRSFADSPGNQYRYYGTSGPGIFVYNGVDGDDTNYSAYLGLRCYQADTDDRNIIYYAYSGTTTTLDYDQNQYFGVKGNARVQGKHQFFSGRVESDESTPNSVYYGGRGGFYCYDTTSTAVAYLLSEAGGSSSTYFAFGRTSNNDTQWKHRTSDGRMYVDATGTTFNGADYAEYFEWSDGNTNNEDRAGYTVVLKNGNKIGIATAGDSPSSIIGVISGVPAIVGDGQDLSWQGKWLKDEFGREITTDVQYLVWNRGYEKDENGNKVPVAQPNPNDQMSMEDSDQQMEVGPKLDAAIAEGDVPQFAIDNNIIMTGQRRVKNPDYNPDAIYVSREFRPEWSPVGLVGKLIVRKGQVMGDRWIKMKDINEQLEQWLVR